jgi:hypothetical protein
MRSYSKAYLMQKLSECMNAKSVLENQLAQLLAPPPPPPPPSSPSPPKKVPIARVLKNVDVKRIAVSEADLQKGMQGLRKAPVVQRKEKTPPLTAAEMLRQNILKRRRAIRSRSSSGSKKSGSKNSTPKYEPVYKVDENYLSPTSPKEQKRKYRIPVNQVLKKVKSTEHIRKKRRLVKSKSRSNSKK